jgi:DNA-binding response OmpR family regulator
VGLTGAECRLLLELLAEAPRPIARSRLIEHLHDREFDPADRSIDVRVSRLRLLLRDKARAPMIIKTLHGKGYMIGVSVAKRGEVNRSALL